MQFKELLSTNSNLNSNRYFRLMTLAGLECCCTIPLASYVIYLNVSNGMSPWISWEDTHSHFNRADAYPAILWRNMPNGEVSLELSRWFLPLCAFAFFGFFGFADEARKHYRLAASTVVKKSGITTTGSGMFSSVAKWGSTTSASQGTMSQTEKGTLPVYISQQTHKKRDSFESFTNMTASSIDMEKSFNGAASFGELDFKDVGGLLSSDSSSGPTKPPALGSSPSSEASKSVESLHKKVPQDVEVDEDDDSHRIEISSVRHPSVAFPEPAHPKHGSDTNV
jgi:pheromone a factor receptor